jgi:NAD(P)-dependent dehydrogenase (short-subunit alcohol dehydrogenase family)
MKSSKIVLVTGATSGIGKATALHLARAGHRVFAVGRRKAALEALESEAAGLALETLLMDVTQADSIARAKAEIFERTGNYGVDVVVNNAGYGVGGPVEEVTDEAFRRQYETNVFGLMAVTRAFLPCMRARRYGRIINVSSVGGRVTVPMLGVYNSTKYAVESLSDALRVELAPFGVKVVIIEPGSIRTEFADVAMSSISSSQRSDYAGAIARAGAFRKLFDDSAVGPEHVARAIAKAIQSKRPAARYVRPWRTYFMLWAKWFLPTSWVDAAMARLAGLTKKHLLGAALGA